jgi:type II secretory pathway predicted ATPase ExeA
MSKETNNTTPMPNPASLGAIELATEAYSKEYEALGDIVARVQDEVHAVQRRHMKALKKAVEAAAEKKSALNALIQSAPSLFKKPRTYVFHGIKVGLQKSKGGLAVADEDNTIALIRKHFAAQAKTLIKIEESVVRKALNSLKVDELKKIGVNVIDTTDFVVIEATSSQIEEAVNALLKDATDEAVAEAEQKQAA